MFFQQFADENFILNNLHKWYGHDFQISQLSKGSENLNYLLDGHLVVRVLYLAKSSPIFSQAFPYLEREVYFVREQVKCASVSVFSRWEVHSSTGCEGWQSLFSKIPLFNR